MGEQLRVPGRTPANPVPAPVEEAPAPRTGERGDERRGGRRDTLRVLTYDEARAALSTGAPSTFFEDLFKRLDRSKDKSLDRNEVIAHLKSVGVSGGLFGIVHKKVADKFIDALDSSRDGKVTLAEFHGVAKQLLPADLFDAEGRVRPDLVEETFRAIDRDGDKKITVKELELAVLAKLPPGTDHREVLAEVASKLGVDALDLDKSGGVSQDELAEAARATAELRAG
jgi:Ca2+-binding EF-hand superfamily protein